MKIALCQLEILWEDKQFNEKRCVFFLKQAAEQKVDLILFPEMSLTGFSMNTSLTKESQNTTCKKFQQYAQQYSIAIGIGWVKAMKDSEKAENHYTIIDKTGAAIYDYTKIHPFSYASEDRFFASGNRVGTFELDGLCMSNFICYDLRFPEVFQMVSEHAHMIIVPANWPDRRSEHWKCLLQARAIENQVYILGVNCTGNQKDIFYSGDSCVINPNGEVLKELHNDEGLLLFDLQDDVEQYRATFPTKKDRKDYATDIGFHVMKVEN